MHAGTLILVGVPLVAGLVSLVAWLVTRQYVKLGRVSWEDPSRYRQLYVRGNVAEAIAGTFFAIAVLVAFVAVLALPAFAIESNACEQFGSKAGLETEYSWSLDCTAQVGDNQIPTGNLRFNDNGEWYNGEG